VLAVKPWESFAKSLEQVSDVQLPTKATAAKVHVSYAHTRGTFSLMVKWVFQTGARTKAAPTSSKPQSTQHDIEDPARKISTPIETPKTPPEVSKKESAALRMRKAAMISPPGMETAPETEDQDTEGSSSLRRSLQNRKKQISSTSAVRMKIRRSPNFKRGKGEKPALSSKRPVEMPEEVRDWEMTSKALTRVELEDPDEIVDMTDVDVPGVHNSFAPPPAKHSLFKSIGMGPPHGQSTPANLSGGTRKRQRSEALSRSTPMFSRKLANMHIVGARAACKPSSY
jgi:hypothetical protein